MGNKPVRWLGMVDDLQGLTMIEVPNHQWTIMVHVRWLGMVVHYHWLGMVDNLHDGQ